MIYLTAAALALRRPSLHLKEKGLKKKKRRKKNSFNPREPPSVASLEGRSLSVKKLINIKRKVKRDLPLKTWRGDRCEGGAIYAMAERAEKKDNREMKRINE